MSLGLFYNADCGVGGEQTPFDQWSEALRHRFHRCYDRNPNGYGRRAMMGNDEKFDPRVLLQWIKLQAQLRHRHLLLKSTEAKLREVTGLEPEDTAFQAAFRQQDCANQLLRGTDRHVQAWNVASGGMLLMDTGNYTTAWY